MGTLKTGMARYMDPQGRLVIPSEMRKQFGLQEGSLVDFQVTEDGICAEAIAAKVGSWNGGR